MITALAAIALMSPAQVAAQTVVPQVPAPAVASYDWKAQKGPGSIDSGSAYQTGSLSYGSGATPEDWQAD